MILPFSEAEKIGNLWRDGTISYPQMIATLRSIGWCISSVYKDKGRLNIDVKPIGVENDDNSSN